MLYKFLFIFYEYVTNIKSSFPMYENWKYYSMKISYVFLFDPCPPRNNQLSFQDYTWLKTEPIDLAADISLNQKRSPQIFV